MIRKYLADGSLHTSHRHRSNVHDVAAMDSICILGYKLSKPQLLVTIHLNRGSHSARKSCALIFRVEWFGEKNEALKICSTMHEVKAYHRQHMTMRALESFGLLYPLSSRMRSCVYYVILRFRGQILARGPNILYASTSLESCDIQ